MCEYDVYIFFFFFQAEDGIRDGRVTGVQTCALPILPRGGVEGRDLAALGRLPGAGVAHSLDDLPDGVDHELGLVVLDDVAAPLGDDMLAVRHECGELVLQRLPQA